MGTKTSKHVEVEIFVALRVADRTALTARRTLHERLGFADILRDIQREDYYRLAVAGNDDEAVSYVRDLVTRTALFANPNKQTFRVEKFKRPLSDPPRYLGLVYPHAGIFSEAFLKRIVFELGYDRVVAAGAGVAWTLTLAPGIAADYAHDILHTRERGAGLLANPHAETFEIV